MSCCVVLCCVVLCCLVLCCVSLYCVVLCCVSFCCVVLCRVVLCCVLSCCVVLCCVVLCCVGVVLCCVVLCCVVLVLCCVVLCCVVLCCVVLVLVLCCVVLCCVVLCCVVLCCVVLCCVVYRCVAQVHFCFVCLYVPCPISYVPCPLRTNPKVLCPLPQHTRHDTTQHKTPKIDKLGAEMASFRSTTMVTVLAWGISPSGRTGWHNNEGAGGINCEVPVTSLYYHAISPKHPTLRNQNGGREGAFGIGVLIRCDQWRPWVLCIRISCPRIEIVELCIFTRISIFILAFLADPTISTS